MRGYEVVYLVDPALPEEEINALVERFTELAKSQGAQVENVTRWDKRKLAYSIKGKREGFYVIMALRGEPAAMAELKRVMSLTEPVLRQLVVRTDGE